jgi:hypothetical protein
MAFGKQKKGRGAELIADAGAHARAEEPRPAASAAQDAALPTPHTAQTAAMATQAGTAAKDTHGAQDDAALARRYFIRDDDSRTRRLFAQEFVTQLKRIGSGTAEQLYDDGMSFFCCDPQDQGAIDYVGRMAQRYGWAQQTDGVWTVTETGNALTPPPSLAVHQVLTRIFSLADPVKTEAKDWVPLIAIVIGATASATAIKGFGTLDVIRMLALTVLVVSVAIQLWGEYQIVIAFNQWRHPPSWVKRDKPIKDDYYSWWRLAVNALFDLAVIAAFGLLIFWQPIPSPTTIAPWLWTVALLVVVIGGLLLILQLRWRKRRKEYVNDRRLDTRLGSREPPRA